MLSVIKWEIKKNLKPGLFAVWAFGLFIAYICINSTFTINDVYADIFSKYYGLAPIMGITMFTLFSGSFVLEYNANVDGLIKSSKSGKKQLIISKLIANGICASIINISILLVMVCKAMLAFGFEGLDMKVKSLWYFGNSGSNLTVAQMLLIVCITVTLGSFLFASIGLYLSSISKKATIPFIFGGLVMGIPYLAEPWISKSLSLNLPVVGMYSQQLIRYKAPISSWIIFIGLALVITTILYNLTKRSFLKEM